MNKTLLIGNLGADPEMRYFPNGDAVCNFSLATSKRWRDKETGDQKEHTEWHKVVFRGKPAEILGEHAKKGMKLCVEGENRTRKWQDRDGNDRWTTEVVCREFEFLDSRTANDSTPAPAPAAQPAPAASDFPDDDDIPF